MTKQEFLKDIGNWSNHRFLLWPALEATKELKLPVLELGCGDGSTPFLQQYCKDNELELHSYDFKADWAEKFGAVHVTNWDNIAWRKDYGVVLVDHSPGEHRKIALGLLTHAQVVVIHDSEPIGWTAADYKVREEFGRYKYQFDLQAPRGQAWATALSNTIDFHNDINFTSIEE
jgi:hypothetical protein